MDNIQYNIVEFLRANGAVDVGFSKVDDGPSELNNAITIVARLSDAVIDEIEDKPTHTYFHHYRSVNQFLDQLSLRCGFLLAKEGYKYIAVAASQSIPTEDSPYQGRYSHKKPAVLSGLGTMGKNNLFLHREFGSRVRLATIFTDLEFEPELKRIETDLCTNCMKCVEICPAGAITDSGFVPALCSEHMKKAYQRIGRGAVCGLCMRVCPALAEEKI